MINNKIKALICGFIFSAVFSTLNLYGKCENISNKIFRLHIIANSDSKEDQSLKLEVRDEILNKFSSDLKSVNNIKEAQKKLESKIKEIKQTAQDVVYKNGFNYEVNAEITRSYFNIRKYNQVTLPSGFYNTLKITLGEGNGKNWWCVMFPPICLSAAEEKLEFETVLNSSELDVIENESEYVIKLKFIEWFMKTQNIIQEFINNILEQSSSFIHENYEIGFKIQELSEDIVSTK